MGNKRLYKAALCFGALWLLGTGICAAQDYDDAQLQARRAAIDEFLNSVSSSVGATEYPSDTSIKTAKEVTILSDQGPETQDTSVKTVQRTTTRSYQEPLSSTASSSSFVSEHAARREATVQEAEQPAAGTRTITKTTTTRLYQEFNSDGTQKRSVTQTAPAQEPQTPAEELATDEEATKVVKKTTTKVYQELVPQAVAVTAPPVVVQAKEPKEPQKGTTITGEIRASMGILADGTTVFTRANADLNEKNYRLLSSAALDRRRNTYDPGIFSRVKVVMDTLVTSAVNMHMNVTIDPWSWTGKSKEMTITGAGGDSVNVQYLFWRNTNYTVNRNIGTLINGDGVSLPEIKIMKGNIVPATTVGSTFGNSFAIPATKIDYTFWPLREFWFDYKPSEKASFRIFPMAYDDQAMSTDDPMRLSNNKSWWEESPWLRGWQAGNYNSGPGDFSKGSWDRSFSFFTRDSDGRYLTALRGASMNLSPGDDTTLQAAIATPKTLWEDYGDYTALPGSVRLKHFFGDSFYMGALGNMHQGFVSHDLDAENYVGAMDAGVAPLDWLKLTGEYSMSRSWYDKTSPVFETKLAGNAFYAELQATSNPGVNPGDVLKKDYFQFAAKGPLEDFYVSKVYVARMDQGFESTLSNYKETRDDAFWSRHLTFYPSTYRYLPGTRPGTSDAGLRSFADGNGIDSGRRVIGWRGDVAVDNGRLNGMADLRRVDSASTDDHIETVARTQWTFQATDQLTTKALFIWNAMPKTVAGIDPFVINSETGEHMVNTEVQGGKDPSLATGGLGARYQLTDWAAINGVWEYSNDSTNLGEDNFYRGVLNSSSFVTYTQNGNIYRKPIPFLYDQSYFDQAPYEYHHIFKAGLQLKPTDIWTVYLDWTRNPNQFAGNIDDNLNHYGIETSIIPTKRFGLFARYTYSQWNDIDRLVFDHVVDYKAFHNFFFEGRLMLKDDSLLSIQYGVGPTYNVQQTSSTNPTISDYTSPVMETQHIVRITLEKKF